MEWCDRGKWQKGNLIDCRDFRASLENFFFVPIREENKKMRSSRKEGRTSRIKCRESLDDSLSLLFTPLIHSFSHSLFSFTFLFLFFTRSFILSLSGRERVPLSEQSVIGSTDAWRPINLATDVISISAGTNRDSIETFFDRLNAFSIVIVALTIPFKPRFETLRFENRRTSLPKERFVSRIGSVSLNI